jgi:reactive intermediate/imine deaminase
VTRTVSTDDAPAPAGPYSQGTTIGDLVFTAGQIAQTPDGDFREGASVAEQTEQVLDNLLAVLATVGAGAADVLKTTVFLVDIDDFAEMNESYTAYFQEDPPARSAVEVGALAMDAAVEIEAIARVPDSDSNSDTESTADSNQT